MKSIPTLIRLPSPLSKWLASEKARTGAPVSEIIRRLIKEAKDKQAIDTK